MVRVTLIALVLLSVLLFGCAKQTTRNLETTPTFAPTTQTPNSPQPQATAAQPIGSPMEANSPENQNNRESMGSAGLQQGYTPLPSCGSNNTLFTHRLMPWEQVLTLTPLGQLTPPGHVFPAPHVYAYVVDWRTQKEAQVPVYAPAGMVLKSIGLRHYNKIGQAADYVDYTLVFSPCAEFELYFHHIRSLEYAPFHEAAQKILAGCNFSRENNEDFCSGEVNIAITAGELFATTGDIRAGVYGLDIGARDYRIETGRDYAKPERHCTEGQHMPYSRCYTVCPFDYFTKELQNELDFSSDSGGGPRISGLKCSNVFVDVAGSLQGYWFKKGMAFDTFSPESDNLFVGPNNLNPGLYAISVGNSVNGLEAGLYDFVPSASGKVNLDPKLVKAAGGIHCFEGKRGEQAAPTVVIAQLATPATLKVERLGAQSCGMGPWAFTQNAAEFER